MSAGAEVLLKKKVYYGNCPGCKQDLRNEEHPGIPYREFVYIWIVTICSALPLCSLYPFLYFMVRDLHIAKRAEDIGFYAGFVGAAFMFGRTLTSVFWGVVADRYGRKPVIMISIVSTIIFNTLFGLSTTFWMAVATRGLLGFFSGLLGPIKAYASEVCRKEHQALGLSLVSTSRGIGLIVGPAIGGLLAQPAEKYPNIFSEKSLFGRFPYFLPCLCISIIAVLAFIACFWLPETLHFHGEHELNDGAADELEAIEKCHLINNAEETERSPSAPKKSLLKNWPLMSAITIYCIFSFNDTAYSEIFSLWAESNVQYGGLSFSSQDVGEVLALTGLGLFLFQLFGYPYLNKALGPVTSSRVAAIISLPVLACYPFMSNLSGFVLKLLITCASFVKNVLSVFGTAVLGFLEVSSGHIFLQQLGPSVRNLATIMRTAKLDLEKFTIKNDFALWRVKMRALLVQQSVAEALQGPTTLLAEISEKEKNDILDRAHSLIILSLGDKALRSVEGNNGSSTLGQTQTTLYDEIFS